MNVTTLARLNALRTIAPALTLLPVSADDMAKHLPISAYPVLITDKDWNSEARFYTAPGGGALQRQRGPAGGSMVRYRTADVPAYSLSGWLLALALLALSTLRLKQGLRILRFRRRMRHLPLWTLSASRIPQLPDSLFLGRGFRWLPTHTQRLYLCRLPQCEHWLRTDRPSASGGDPLLHGVELHEGHVTLPLRDRPGHTLVLGTTRVGKTRLAELLIAQDIRRGDTVVVFDPKGDADLLRRVWAEAHRAGRESVFWLFHLGWPEISARYNAVGRFGRISEVASRIAGQLSTEGNSAAFSEFAWRFVNIITRAPVALGQRPDYARIARHVINIDELFIDYARVFLPGHDRQAWDSVVRIAGGITEKNTPRNLQGRDSYVVALEQYLSTTRLHDPILDGLRSAVRYDKTYFDKIVASLLPLLEKLTTGKIAQLLAPDYGNLNDPRPVFDWQQAIRLRAIVYVGLDALSDAEIAAAVGNSMFADLVSVAGHIYKHGVMDGLPQPEEKAAINLHCDEFSELMGDEFITLINKGGGAGVQVTAYTQTLSDIEARIGDRAKTGGGRQLQQPDHDAGTGNHHRRIVDEATASGGSAQQQRQFRRHRQRRRSWQHRVFQQHPGSGKQHTDAATGTRLTGATSQRSGVRSAGRWPALEVTHPVTGYRTRSADAGKHRANRPLYGKTVRQRSRMVEPPGGSCNGEKRPYFMAERQRNHGETDR